MSEYFSPDYKVLIWATERLCRGLRYANIALFRQFLVNNLVTMQVEHMCNNNNVNRDIFVQAMVTTLQDRVRNEPKAYYNINDILKAEIGISYLGDILEDQRKKMTERLETEKKQRELGIMEAEKKYQKPEEDEQVDKQLHYQDMTGQEGCLPGHKPEDLLTSKTEAAERPQQASKATAIAKARRDELAYMRPHNMPFVGLKQVNCVEGGDTLPLPAIGQENMPEDR